MDPDCAPTLNSYRPPVVVGLAFNPTAPLDKTVSKLVPVDDAMENKFPACPEEPCTNKLAAGLVVPMPTLPACVTCTNETPEVEEISKGSMADVPVTDKRAEGVVVPMPTLPFWSITMRSVEI